jgi:hypothetical protein
VLAGWTQPKGGMYNQLQWNYYITKKKFSSIDKGASGTPTGGVGGIRRYEAPKFTARDLTYYGEYGITNKITVFTSIPLWKEAWSEDTVKYAGERGPSGIGDINIGLRHKISDTFFSGPLSAQATVKIPEAYEYGHPLRDLSLGDGQYDLTWELFWGRAPFIAGRGYVWLLPGYKFRFENNEYDPLNFKPSDQIKLMMGGGYPITSKISVRWLIDWAKSVGNASVSQELIVSSYTYGGGLWYYYDHILIRDTLALESDSLNAGLSLVYAITPKSHIVLSYQETLEGIDIFESKDTSLGKMYSVAVSYSF